MRKLTPNPTDPRTDDRVELSVVVPFFNEELNVNALFQRLLPVLDELRISYEVIAVDDGSRDATLDRLSEWLGTCNALRIIGLSRNFGKEVALTAGLDHAEGRAVVLIDGDLQDPPELIAPLVEKWRDGHEVVYATRTSRAGESWLKRTTADLFYRIASHSSRVEIPRNTGDFRLLDRRVVLALRQLPERRRFMKGLFAWVGFKQTSVPFDRQPRNEGRSAWSYWSLWNLALEGLTSFTTLPLRVWSYFGIGLAVLSATVFLAMWVFGGLSIVATILLAVLFMSGVQFIGIGILGEYLGRVFDEVKGRPLYLVRDQFGFHGHGSARPVEERLARGDPGRITT